MRPWSHRKARVVDLVMIGSLILQKSPRLQRPAYVVERPCLRQKQEWRREGQEDQLARVQVRCSRDGNATKTSFSVEILRMNQANLRRQVLRVGEPSKQPACLEGLGLARIAFHCPGGESAGDNRSVGRSLPGSDSPSTKHQVEPSSCARGSLAASRQPVNPWLATYSGLSISLFRHDILAHGSIR